MLYRLFVLYLHRVIRITLRKYKKLLERKEILIVKFTKMTFNEYMNTLPNLKKETIEKLSKACCVTTTTVYRWISGEITPDALKRKTIAECLSINEDELFPKLKNNGMC